MKRFISALTLICIIFVLLLSSGTFAWMSDNGMGSLVDITGKARQSYFESGDGTKETPYEIKYPVQLYYFAWLQYLGYFNVDNDKNGQIDTVYFYLSDDIDMDYVDEVTKEQYHYVLPPIGTTVNPFLGNFDGRGHTIYDLTVENQHATLLDPPKNINSNTYKGVDVIGFFGVIGDDADNYDHDNNVVKDFVLENLTVKTSTENALIGLVAGYVNGTVDCVGVVGSKVDIKSGTKVYEGQSSISEFALIGYCKDEFKDDVYVMDVIITAPDQVDDAYQVISSMTGQGPGQGWGGSIKMQDIYTWLTDIRNRNDITVDNYIWSRTDVKTLGGLTVTVNKGEEQKKTYEIDGFGSFVFSTASSVGHVNFVSGAQSVMQYEYVRSDTDAKLFYVTYKINKTTNYLCFNSTSKTLENTTDDTKATKWIVSDGANGGVISTIVDGTIYFVDIKDGALGILSDKEANPTSLLNMKIESNTFETKLVYNNGWKATGVTIKSGNNGLGYSNRNGNYSVSTSNSNTQWMISATDSGYTISAIIAGKRRYLGYTVSSNAINATLSEYPTIWNIDTNNNRIFVYLDDNSDTPTPYYLKYSSNIFNSGWRIESGNSNASLSFSSSQSDNIELISVSNDNNLKGYEIVKESYVDNSTKNGYYNENGERVPNKDGDDDVAGITYFPLSSTVTVGTSTTTYKPSERNTGYIIGAEWDSNTEVRDIQDTNPSNIRISRYDTGSITNVDNPYVISYMTGGNFVELNELRKDQTKANSLVKLSKCYDEFKSSIASYCFGLHFMDAPVSINNLTEITAHLSGSEKPIENYQVPTNCIDFTLYERGFINAFAGSYFQQSNNNDVKNDSIFSIYHIIRSEEEGHTNEIDDIKEISKVYALKNTDGTINTDEDYVYIYVGKDETQREQEAKREEALKNNEEYILAFDCKWINNSAAVGGWEQNCAYYFEMPVNAGEYAIGSTEGKTGAYLVYLDLAANAQIIERTKEYEQITEIKSEATLPSGVEILQSATDYETGDINSVNSSFVSINSGTSGTISFEKTNETVIKHSAESGTTPQYIGSNSTLLDGQGNEMQLPSTTTVIRRTTYYDHNLNTDAYIVTVITETTVTADGEEPVTTYHRKITTTVQNEDGSTTTTVTEDNVSTPNAPDPTKEEMPETVVSAGLSYLTLGFAYDQAYTMTVRYEYTPATEGENEQEGTNAIYRIIISNGGTENAIVRATLTNDYDGSIDFVIVDGNGKEVALEKKTDLQKITVVPTQKQG